MEAFRLPQLLLFLLFWCHVAPLSASRTLVRRVLRSEDDWRHRDLLKRRREGECWSQQEQHFYYQHFEMATELGDSLKQYEQMHQKCTENHDWEVAWKDWQQNGTLGQDGCKYLIYGQPSAGLGNRLLSVVSAFAVALLTNRTLLIPDDVFEGAYLCNPLVVSNWTHTKSQGGRLFNTFRNASQRMENLLTAGKSWEGVPSVEVDLASLANASAARFFCPEVHENFLQHIPVIFIRADVYIVPSLYFIPKFAAQFQKWFPDGRSFLHLGRFLIHPINSVWFRITRYHDAYLRHHNRLVGVQIRQFFTKDDDAFVDERVLECVRSVAKIVPDWVPEEQFLHSLNEGGSPTTLASKQWESIGIFVAALNGSHVDALSEFMSNNIPSEGQLVSVYSMSNEGGEKHDAAQFEKALMEMILLSMCDSLLITDWSTFGYIAAALAGSTPFSMNIVTKRGLGWVKNGRPVCQPAFPEPCQHQLPAKVDRLECAGGSKPITEIHPNIRRCVDANETGIQFNPTA